VLSTVAGTTTVEASSENKFGGLADEAGLAAGDSTTPKKVAFATIGLNPSGRFRLLSTSYLWLI